MSLNRHQGLPLIKKLLARSIDLIDRVDWLSSFCIVVVYVIINLEAGMQIVIAKEFSIKHCKKVTLALYTNNNTITYWITDIDGYITA